MYISCLPSSVLLLLFVVFVPPAFCCFSSPPECARFQEYRQKIEAQIGKLKVLLHGTEQYALVDNRIEKGQLNDIAKKLERYETSFAEQVFQLSKSLPESLRQETLKYEQTSALLSRQNDSIAAIEEAVERLEKFAADNFGDTSGLLHELNSTIDVYLKGSQEIIAETGRLIAETGVRLAGIKEASAGIHSAVNDVRLLQGIQKRKVGKLSGQLDKLGQMASQLREGSLQNEVDAKAHLLKNASFALQKLVAERYNEISARLDQVLRGQNRLELVMLFSKTANRIEYLASKFKRLAIHFSPATFNFEPADEAVKWARAVIDGHPSDQRVSDLLEDINILLGGDEGYLLSGSQFPDPSITVPQNSLFLFYADSIKELVAYRRFEIAEPDFDVPWTAQSERYYMDLFIHEAYQLQQLGFVMQWQAKQILDHQNDQTSTANESQTNGGSDGDGDDENFVLNLSQTGARRRRRASSDGQFYVVDDQLRESWQSKLTAQVVRDYASQNRLAHLVTANLSKECPIRMNPLTAVPATSSSGIIRIFELTHVNIGIFTRPKTGNLNQQLLGCRLTTEWDSYVFTQCYFRNFAKASKVDSKCGELGDVIFPNNTLSELEASRSMRGLMAADKTSSKTFRTQRVNKVVTGMRRVRFTGNETVCGLRVSMVDIAGESAVVLAIDVCSMATGRIVLPIAQLTAEELHPQHVATFTHINTNWLCPTPVGSISGAGFQVVEEDNKRILTIVMESVFKQPY